MQIVVDVAVFVVGYAFGIVTMGVAVLVGRMLYEANRGGNDE